MTLKQVNLCMRNHISSGVSTGSIAPVSEQEGLSKRKLGLCIQTPGWQLLLRQGPTVRKLPCGHLYQVASLKGSTILQEQLIMQHWCLTLSFSSALFSKDLWSP